MKNVYYLLCCLMASVFTVQAQTPSGKIEGTVYDSAAKKGLSYATVSIVSAKDSTLVTFTRADSSGHFSLQSLKQGKYIVSASSDSVAATYS
ncbi:MAG: carboxypeptidase regulatory-like domain-containing protein [Chitinophagaceae bacterium]